MALKVYDEILTAGRVPQPYTKQSIYCCYMSKKVLPKEQINLSSLTTEVTIFQTGQVCSLVCTTQSNLKVMGVGQQNG